MHNISVSASISAMELRMLSSRGRKRSCRAFASEYNPTFHFCFLFSLSSRVPSFESDGTLRRDITSSPRSESEDLSTRRGSPQSTPLSFTSLHFTRYLSFTSARFYSKRPLHVKLTPGSPLKQEDDVSTHIDSADSQRDSSSRKLYNGWM